MNARTVLGDVPAPEVGTALVHEHLVFDVSAYHATALDPRPEAEALTLAERGDVRLDPFAFPENLVHRDIDLTVSELEGVVRRGGRTVVDPTNVDMGRDPDALREIARRTGLHVVMGSGYYTQVALSDAFVRRSIDDVAAEMIADVRDGVGTSGVRSGLLGEVGTSAPITAAEERSLRAASRAQAETGAPLMVHLDGWGREGHRVLDVVEEEGADPARTILCHMNPSCDDARYQAALAERGAYVEYDMMGMTYVYPAGRACPDDAHALEGIRRLIEAGHADRVLISQDVFLTSMFRRYGGLGYVHVLDTLGPIAERAGVDAHKLTRFLTDNAALAIATFPPADAPPPPKG